MHKFLTANRIGWSLLSLLLILAARDLIIFSQDPSIPLSLVNNGHNWKWSLWQATGMTDRFTDGVAGCQFNSAGSDCLLPYLIGSLLTFLGITAHTALNLCWILAFTAAGISMYWAGNPMMGRWGALLAATLYTFAPYHLLDTFLIANLAGTCAYIFPPIIIRSLWTIRSEPTEGITLGAVAFLFMAMTNLSLCYVIGFSMLVFLAIYTLLLSAPHRIQFLKNAGLMGIFSICLSAYIWLPDIINSPTIEANHEKTAATTSYISHLVQIKYLFPDIWHLGFNSAASTHNSLFLPGIIMFTVAILATLLSLYCIAGYLRSKVKRNTEIKIHKDDNLDRSRFVIACSITAFCMILLTVICGSFLLSFIPFVRLVHAPWQFLMPAMSFLAMSAGTLPKLFNIILLKRKWTVPILSLLLSCCILASYWGEANYEYHQTYINNLLTNSK